MYFDLTDYNLLFFFFFIVVFFIIWCMNVISKSVGLENVFKMCQ